MGRPSRFTDAQRRDAVARAFDGEQGPEVVAAELDVHPATIYRWAGELSGSGGPRRPEARGSISERLVRSAQQLLREHDYPDITMTALAERAGVSVRSAYQSFATKQDLFSAAVDDAATQVVEQIALDTPRHLGADPLRQLEELLLAAARRVYAVPASHVLFCDVGLPQHAVGTARWHQLFVDVVTRLLTEARAADQIGPHDDPEQLAEGVVAGVRGVHAAVLGGATDAPTGLRLVRALARAPGTGADRPAAEDVADRQPAPDGSGAG